MAYTSSSFVVLVCITLIVYYSLPRNIRWVSLLVSSLAFYVLAGFNALIYIIFTSILVYFIALKLQKINDKQKNLFNSKDNDWLKEHKKEYTNNFKKEKKKYLLLALIISLGILIIVKYLPTFLNSAILFFSINTNPVNILMPLGISFYTFTSIAYLVDIFYGKIEAEKNYFKFLLFISFFPAIVQGPISRANQLLPQLIKGNAFNTQKFCFGSQLILWGLIKKLVIADILVMFSNSILNDINNYSGSVILLATIFGSIELYTNFSGGIDIIRGVAECFGIDMVQNFKQPFFSVGLTDYWRRWHISLGAFMKDYVLMPLNLSKFMMKIGKKSRNKFGVKVGKLVPVFISTFIVFFLVGIWHGPNFKYIVFGLLNGFITSMESLYQNLKTKKEYTKIGKTIKYVFSLMYGILIVHFVKIISMSNNVTSAFTTFEKIIFDFNIHSLNISILDNLQINVFSIIIAILTFILVLFVEILKENNIQVRNLILKQNIVIRYAIWIGLIFFMLIYSSHGNAMGGFAYEGF